MRNRIRMVGVIRLAGRSPYWYCRWWELDGRRWREKWKSTRSTRKADAEKLRREIERDLDAGKRHDADMPWDDLVAEFKEKHASAKSPHTAAAYHHFLAAFTKTAKPSRLKDVGVAMLEDYR